MLVGLSLQTTSNYRKLRSWARFRVSKHKTIRYRPRRLLGISALRLRKATYYWYPHRWSINYTFAYIKYNYCNSVSPNFGYKFQYQAWWLPYHKYKEWRH